MDLVNLKIPPNIFELDEVASETMCSQLLPNPERAANVSCAAKQVLVATVKVRVGCIRAESTFWCNVQFGAAGCENGFVKCFLGVLQAVGLYRVRLQI